MLTTAFLGVAHIHTPGFISKIATREGVTVKAVYDHEAERGQKAEQGDYWEQAQLHFKVLLLRRPLRRDEARDWRQRQSRIGNAGRQCDLA